jgi:hypothetical protein
MEREEHPAFCHEDNPTLDKIASCLLAASGRYTEFRYDRRRWTHERVAMTPSRAAAEAATVKVGPLDEVKGYAGGVEGGGVWVTKDGNWVLTLLTMNRRKLDGRYQWRSYRLEGIKLETVRVNMGGRLGKVRTFPAVVPVDSEYVENAAVLV